jgi:hypothetical protein
MTQNKDKRIAELEERLHYANGCCDLAMKHRDAAERRADVLEQALQYMAANLRLIAGYDRISGDHEDCEVARETLNDPTVRAALAQQECDNMASNDPVNASMSSFSDQPAQDGEQLDPYTLAYVEKMVRGQQYKDGPYRQWPEFWPGNRSNDSMVTQFADRAADAIRNLQPDQPADAGESSVDQARFERVWKQLVYSLADFFALEITDAQAQSIAREVLKAAGAGEPSCCARTREEERKRCVKIVEQHYCTATPIQIAAAIRRNRDTP